MKYLFRKKRNIVLISLLDAVGGWLYGLRRITKPDHSREALHFLVIRLDHIGDALIATAVPKAIKENYPKARVTFLAGSWGAPLLENNPFIDQVLIYDAPWFARGQKAFSWADYFTLGRKLRGLSIDVALGLRGDLRENFLMAHARIPKRIGYGVTGGSFWLTDVVPYRQGVHEEEHLRDLLNLLSIKTSVLKPGLYLSEKEKRGAEEWALNLGLLPDTRWVGIQVGAGASSKDWPKTKFERFLELFGKHFPAYGLVFLGNNPEKMNELRLVEGVKYLNLVGRTSLRDLLVLMAKFAAFVGPDSGPTHIAAAMGVPTVFIYSGTNDIVRWKPLSEEATVLRHEVSCSPCEREICNVNGHPCLAGISPESVLRALEGKLK